MSGGAESPAPGAAVVERSADATATTPGPKFGERVVAWQRTHGRRGLPWQETRDPYRVWLSEVMLQQTQVAMALPFYTRFLERFADVGALAAAPLGDVLALWSGLGYYGRARNLHRCAQVVVAEHGGAFPGTSAELARLPGIGRSTAAAIAAFCFGERVAILDGNVKRVLTRVLAFAGDLAEPAQERRLWDAASALLPPRHVESYTQGLMDLGATICLPRAPLCLLCPVNEVCAAARAGTQERYPLKTKKLKRSARASVWLELRWRDQVWLVERPARGIWAGLWSLPELATLDDLQALTNDWPGTLAIGTPFVHVLTHLDWRLQPVCWQLPARAGAARVARLTASWPQGRWFDIESALGLGVPAPLRKLLRETLVAPVAAADVRPA